MFAHRSRGRGAKPLWSWLLRPKALQKLLVVLAAVAFLGVHLHFLNSTARRYKDCSVPWVSHAAAAAATTGGAGAAGKRLRIALVSMSTGKARDAAAARRQSDLNARSAEFAGLLDLTGPNKRRYAELHGYTFVDASELLDASRPASWSKIPAVLSVLDSYDWVFWNDADTVITNVSVPLEALLPASLPGGDDNDNETAAAAGLSAESVDPGGSWTSRSIGGAGGGAGGGGSVGSGWGRGPDLILTADSTGVNAGVWLLRGAGCSWCRSFLETWWGMEGFVRRGRGDTKSGDNDALKALIAGAMGSSPQLAAHVGLAPQCAFNSYVWRPSLRNWARYLTNPRRILTGLWQPGDFLMHPAGLKDKRQALLRALAASGVAGTPGAMGTTSWASGPGALGAGAGADAEAMGTVAAATGAVAGGGSGVGAVDPDTGAEAVAAGGASLGHAGAEALKPTAAGAATSEGLVLQRIARELLREEPPQSASAVLVNGRRVGHGDGGGAVGVSGSSSGGSSGGTGSSLRVKPWRRLLRGLRSREDSGLTGGGERRLASSEKAAG